MDEGGGIVSASLVLYLSVSRAATIAGTLRDLEHLELLRRRFALTPYYDVEQWARTRPAHRRCARPHGS